MPRFIVSVKEVYIQPVSIEAESVEDALRKVKDGDGEYLEDQHEYCYSLPFDEWNVYEEK